MTRAWVAFLFIAVLVSTTAWTEDFDSSNPPLSISPPQWINGPNLKDLILWSEFLSYAEVESHLQELKGRNAALNVAVHADDPHYDELIHLFKAAEQYQVSIRPWLLLSQQDLYWFNKWNLQASQNFVHTFLQEMRARGASPEWLIFDVEPRQDVVDDLIALESKNSGNLLEDLFALPGEYFQALDILTKWSRIGNISDATTMYQNLVKELHSQGVKVEVVTTNFVLHDLADHKKKAQSAFGIAITDVPWDRISIMLYRAEIGRLFGDITSNMVYQYSLRAKQFFGDRAVVALGEVGHVQFPHPREGFKDPQDLHDDIAAAKAAGVDEIEIYSLDGMIDKGLDFWLTPTPVLDPTQRDIRVSAALTFLDFSRGLLPKGK